MEKEIKELLLQCKVTGVNAITVPKARTVEIRNAVFEKLESIGGVWRGGKSSEFDFKEDPRASLQKLIADHTDINDDVLCTKCKDKLTLAEKMQAFPFTDSAHICDHRSATSPL